MIVSFWLLILLTFNSSCLLLGANSTSAGPSVVKGIGTPIIRQKNYASPDCGAKILASNQEATSTSAVLDPSRDEYLLSTCTSKIWFVIELCEAIQAKKVSLSTSCLSMILFLESIWKNVTSFLDVSINFLLWSFRLRLPISSCFPPLPKIFEFLLAIASPRETGHFWVVSSPATKGPFKVFY